MLSSRGPKIRTPTTTEHPAVTSVAPAAMSFTRPAAALCSGLTMSTSSSVAVFRISEAMTSPIAREMQHYSFADSSK